jgi:hypothetical protein
MQCGYNACDVAILSAAGSATYQVADQKLKKRMSLTLQLTKQKISYLWK